MENSVFYASAASLAKRVSNGEISCANLINEFYNRIKKHNNALNAIVIDNKKEALETARKLDIDLKEGNIKGALHGVPITLKESFNLKGLKTTINFKLLKNNIATED